MGAALVPLMIASSVVSAVGAMKQADAQAASYQAQAQANEYNATVARNNAQVASEQANAKEEAQRRHFAALQGQAITGVAQSGTGFDGSNADILKQNAINSELDALTIRYEGQNQSKGLLAQSQLETYNAGVNRMNASNAQQAGMFNAGANLLSGAAKYSYYSGTGKLPGMV
jgi:hypothetical protein